jgi:hypothetical protein
MSSTLAACTAALAAAAPPSPPASQLGWETTILSEAAKGDNPAVCLDGSPAGYHIQTKSADAWTIHLVSAGRLSPSHNHLQAPYAHAHPHVHPLARVPAPSWYCFSSTCLFLSRPAYDLVSKCLGCVPYLVQSPQQGGGWCTSPEDCLRRSMTPLGSSKSYTTDMDGILGGTIRRHPLFFLFFLFVASSRGRTPTSAPDVRSF